TLLTKSNFGHSTLTVNDSLHKNNGFVPLTNFKGGENPEATFDMSAVFGTSMKSASRRFLKENNHSILIEDKMQLSDATKNITWQIMTTADVEIVKGGVVLKQGGKEMKLQNLSHPELTFSVVSLDPPPLELDRKIENLKRIEMRLPAYLFPEKQGVIQVRLMGAE
ncbi:MAG: hypothetical protein ABIR06_16135, partial [Cyclobacteriaceae bacterium]